MPSNYSGNASNVTGLTQVTIQTPSDGDTLNAASVNTALKLLADFAQSALAFILALFSTANTWTAKQTVNTTGGTTAVLGANSGSGIGVQGTSGTGAGVEGTASNGIGGVFVGGGGSPGVTGTGGGSAGGAGGYFTAGSSPANGAIHAVPQATPSAPANGDIWVDTTTNTLSAQVNGSTVKIGSKPVAPTALSGLTYANGWAAGTPAPRYWVDELGYTHLSGQLATGAVSGAQVTTNPLPAAARPTGQVSIEVPDLGGASPSAVSHFIQISSGGVITMANFSGYTGAVSLDNVVFPTF